MDRKLCEIFISTGLWHRDRALTRSSYTSENMHAILKRIVRGTLVELIFYAILIASYLWMAVSLFWDIHGADAQWFQRSGAIIVAAAIFSEFFVFNNKKARAVVKDFIRVSGRLLTIRQLMEYFGFISIVLGTIIWAYGDLLI